MNLEQQGYAEKRLGAELLTDETIEEVQAIGWAIGMTRLGPQEWGVKCISAIENLGTVAMEKRLVGVTPSGALKRAILALLLRQEIRPRPVAGH